MNNIQFEYPWILYLLWLAPLLALAWHAILRRSEEQMARFISPLMQARLRPPRQSSRAMWQVALTALGLFLAMFAAARPQWGSRDERVFKRGRDLMIVLDVSQSMLAADVRPSRLQRAKADILDLIKELEGDRAGLLAFRYKGVLLCPLTTDYGYLRQMLDGAEPGSAPRGPTDIGDAIAKALDSFDTESGAHRAIVLITDGEDLSGNATNLAARARELQTPIFTVGIGSRQGATIQDPENRRETLKFGGKDVVSRIDEATLNQLARDTGGAYIPIGTSSTASTTLGMIYRDHLRKIAAQDFEETQQHSRIERFHFFLFPAVILLAAAASLSRGRLTLARRQPPAAGPVALLVAAVLAGWTVVPAAPAADTSAPTAPNVEVASPPDVREEARQALHKFQAGDYLAAADIYLRLADSVAGNLQIELRRNAAIALHRAGKTDQAATILRGLADTASPADTATRRTELGAMLYEAAATPNPSNDPAIAETRVGQLQEAGLAFRDALRTRPADDTAAQHLGAVVQALPDAEEQAHVLRLNKQYADTPIHQLTQDMLQRQRQICSDGAEALNDATPGRIKRLEDLAARQKEAGDLWIPLKSKLLSAGEEMATVTNREQRAMLGAFADATRQNMQDASAALRDLDPTGVQTAQSVEPQIYHVWKGVAPYDALLTEDLRRQTNSLHLNPERTPPRPDQVRQMQSEQEEAAALTDLFTRRFEQAYPMENAASWTNVLSPEARQKIVDLSSEAARIQREAVTQAKSPSPATARPAQQDGADILRQVVKLLPKKDPKQPEPQENKTPEKQPEPRPQQNPEQNPQPQEARKSPADDVPRDVAELIQKALEREKEHQEDKQRRLKKMPLPSDGRDW